MDFDKVIEKRASIRKFSSKKPEIEKIIKIIDTGNKAPSPGNLPILRYIIIEEQDKIEKITESCQQSFIRQAPFVVVICSKSDQINRAYDIRATKYVKHHTGAVIENMLLKLTSMGLDACWVGAYSEVSLRNALKIPNNLEIEAIIPIGYPHISDRAKQKRKPKLYDRVFYETFGNTYKKPFRSANPG